MSSARHSEVTSMACCSTGRRSRTVYIQSLEITISESDVRMPINGTPPLIYMRDDRYESGRWAFCWRNGGEIIIPRGDYHRYLRDGEHLLFREVQTKQDGWVNIIVITPIIFQGDDIQQLAEKEIYVKYHDWNDLTYWLGSLPTQLIDYSHFKYSADPFRFIQWRQYSIAEDEFLMKYIEKVRRYPKKYTNLGPP